MRWRIRAKDGERQGWLSAAVVFAVGVVAASALHDLTLPRLDWSGSPQAGSVQMLRASNTRPLVMLPLPRS